MMELGRFRRSASRRCLMDMLEEPTHVDDVEGDEAGAPPPAPAPTAAPRRELPPREPSRPAPAELPPAPPEALRLPARPGGAVLLGVNGDGAAVRWDLETANNGFLVVFGASGSGKTEALRVAAMSTTLPALVVDFHGDVASRGLSVRPLSVGDLNPLEVVTERGPLEQAARFVGAVSRAVPSFGHVQSARLREAVLAAYEAAGLLQGDAASWARQAPTIADLRRQLAAGDNPRVSASVTAALDSVFGVGSGPRVNLRTLLRSGGRVDLSALSQPAQVLAAEVLLEQLWSALRDAGALSGGRYRVLLVLDESVILRGSPALDTLFREARKFGLALAMAAQSVGEVSSAVRNNAASVLQLHLETAAEAASAARLLRGVSPAELLRLPARGAGYLRAGTETTAVRVLALDSAERRALKAAPAQTEALTRPTKRR